MAEVAVVDAAVSNLKLPVDNGARDYLFTSRFPDIEIPTHVSLPCYIFEKAGEYPEKTCIIDYSTGREYTYRETEVNCRRVAAGLAKLGIGQGDVVMLLLPNCAEFVFLFFGVVMRGSIATTANPLYKPAEIHRQVRISDARLIITQSACVEKLAEEFQKHIRILTIDGPPNGYDHVSILLEADEHEFPDIHADPEDVIALPFSSGTTGLPKGVMLTHRSLIWSVAQQVDGENPNLHLTSEDVVLCLLPLIHIFSLNSVMLCCLRAGAALAIMQKFDVIGLLEYIQKYRISFVAVVPPIVLAIAKCPTVEKYDLSSIKKVLSGAAPLGEGLEDVFRSRLPQAILGQGYGMTEAGPVLAMCPGFAKHPFPGKPGSCGVVVRNAHLKIVDLETGASLPHNESGEICIRGNQIMKGYLNDPESTALIIDKDGFLHTGDVGYVDDDGEVFIVDRVKEIIKYKGYQVPPAELESMLVSHPSIADAAVVPEPDQVAGELPVAFVVRAASSDISEEEIKQFIAKQVVFYKRICKVYFIDSIPKSPTGKILRRELKKRFSSQH
eukprot:c17564_g1_i1 orf=333-1997(+)